MSSRTDRARGVGASFLLLPVLLLGSPACTNMGAAVNLASLIAQDELSERLLPVRTDYGSQVLAEATAYSATVEDYVAANGKPDYVMVEMPEGLVMFTFLYAKTDTAVYFRKPNALSLTGTYGAVIQETPMPRALLGRMSDADQAIASADPRAIVGRDLYGQWRDPYRIGSTTR